jgi:hypothetical protein
MDRRLGWPQSHSGHSDEEKNFQPTLEIEALKDVILKSKCSTSEIK